MKTRISLGLLASAAWVLLFALLAWHKCSEWPTMELNQWGDFFAGAAAPVALLWLVLGYLQQGEELGQNTEALKAQQAELARQVQETKALAEHSERQAIAAEQMAIAQRTSAEQVRLKERAESMLSLRAEGGSHGGGVYKLQFRNVGASVADLSVEFPAGLQVIVEPKSVLDSGQQGSILIREPVTYPIDITFIFRTRLGEVIRQTYILPEPFKLLQRYDDA